MKKWLLALVLALPIGLSAQKIDVDDGILTVDGVPYCRLEKIKTGLVADYRVLSLDSTALIYLKRRAYHDPCHVSQTNSKGEVAYFEWTFLASGLKAETDQVGQKAIAKKLHAADLSRMAQWMQRPSATSFPSRGSRTAGAKNNWGNR